MNSLLNDCVYSAKMQHMSNESSHSWSYGCLHNNFRKACWNDPTDSIKQCKWSGDILRLWTWIQPPSCILDAEKAWFQLWIIICIKPYCSLVINSRRTAWQKIHQYLTYWFLYLLNCTLLPQKSKLKTTKHCIKSIA